MTTRRRRPPSRSRGRTRRRGVGWPWWVRLVVGGLAVAAVVVAVLWFDALPAWVKATSIATAALAVALWWLWTRRAEIAAEMRRRDADQRAGRQSGSGPTAGGRR
jgi:hypothetical protein